VQSSKDTKFNALPFQSTEGITNLLLKLSFTPEVLLGLDSPIGGIGGGVGAVFDIPELTVNVTQLDGVDRNCKPLRASDDDDEGRDDEDDLDSFIDDIVGDYTHIVPTVHISAGVFGEVGIDIANFQRKIEKEVTLVKATVTLPTTCLVFDEESKSYGPPPTRKPEAPGDSEDGDGSGSGSGSGSGTGSAGRVRPADLQTSLLLCAMLASALAFGAGVY
jgi:hypothetical protein